MSAKPEVGVVGAGAWGTALALAAHRAGCAVTLWGRDAGLMDEMRSMRENTRYLPQISLPSDLHFTSSFEEIAQLPVLLLVTPAQTLRHNMQQIRPFLAPRTSLIVCAKGIERSSGTYLSQVVQSVAPHHPVGVLSGPGFANDVGRGLPTALTLALADQNLGEQLAQMLSSPSFRLYWSGDVLGVELGGAMKNIFAIASGIVMGRGLGESARAALIARSFAELVRMGRAVGAQTETFSGLSGLGDLVLTATSEQSRNFRFGLALGRGEPPDAALARMGTVEGAASALAAAQLAVQLVLDMPLSTAIARVIQGQESIDATIQQLMMRPLRAEF